MKSAVLTAILAFAAGQVLAMDDHHGDAHAEGHGDSSVAVDASASAVVEGDMHDDHGDHHDDHGEHHDE